MTSNLFKAGRPFIKFRPTGMEDVEEAEKASKYINNLFMHKLDGYNIVDKTVFNAALLKICPVRVRMKHIYKQENCEFKYDGYSMEDFEEELALYFVANPELADLIQSTPKRPG